MVGRTETLPQVGSLDVHDHASWVFSSDDEHRAVVTSFICEGLARGERVMFLGSPSSRAHSVAGQLAAGRLDVDALLASGQLVIGVAEDANLVDGRFDVDAQLRTCESLVRQALADGCSGFRVAAELAWLHANPVARSVWPGYEFRADLLAARLPFTALCAYDARLWQPGDLALLEALHNVAPREAAGAGAARFRLHGQRDGSIRLSGELDIAFSAQVVKVFDHRFEHAASPVLDVAELEFIDASGIRAVAFACQSMAKTHGRVTIRGASAMFRKVWQLAGCDRINPVIVVE